VYELHKQASVFLLPKQYESSIFDNCYGPGVHHAHKTQDDDGEKGSGGVFLDEKENQRRHCVKLGVH
jgi:hypothetical protein